MPPSSRSSSSSSNSMTSRNVTFQLDHHGHSAGGGRPQALSQPRHHAHLSERVVPQRPSLKPSTVGQFSPPRLQHAPQPMMMMMMMTTPTTTVSQKQLVPPMALPSPPPTPPPRPPRPPPAPGLQYVESADTNSVMTPTSLSSDPNEVWRKHGKVFRAELVVKDEEKGGNTFALSNSCSIERYYKVSERVCYTYVERE
jgi:hypothetical protein